MSRFVVLCMLICMPGILWAACPDGFTEYLGPSGGLIRDINGNCGQLCGAGVTSLKTSNGYSFDLFETKNTDRAISVKVGDTICYADLATGAMSNTLNVKAGDMTYHANPDSGNLCPITYKLSYSCGDGAIGTPPETREIGWGDLYNCPDSAESCRKPGYSFTGWKIDSTSLTKGNVYNYKYTADKTMVAQWQANSYGAAYLCNNGTTVSSYLNGKYGNSVTPSTTVCTAADGATFAGWRVLDTWGNDTGDTVAPGASFTWNYPYNIQLQAIWE